MNNFEVAKKYLGDIQAVVTEALDNLDRLPTDTASVLDNITTESFCYELLKKYIAKYEEIAGVAIPEEGLSLTAQDERDDLKVSLEELAQRPKSKPNENEYSVLVNMASIVFILRCDGLSVLMLGDCFPHQIVEALIARGYSKENSLRPW